MTIVTWLVAVSAAAFCPSASEVSADLGIAVRVLPQGTMTHGSSEICAWLATSSQAISISLTAQPYDAKEDPIARVRSSAKLMTGVEAERIDIGDGGYAYGSKTKSEAAARKGNRVYYAEVIGAPDKKAGVIALLKRVVK
jgi:hypothetical protein